MDLVARHFDHCIPWLERKEGFKTDHLSRIRISNGLKREYQMTYNIGS